MSPEEKADKILEILNAYPSEERPAVTLRLLAGVLAKMDAAGVLEYRLGLNAANVTSSVLALADAEVARRQADGR